MSKQFFYTRETETEVPSNLVGVPPTVKNIKHLDSFNLGEVLRTEEEETEGGEKALIVFMNDGHEKTVQVPGEKKNEIRNVRQYGCTVLYLFGEDVARFREANGYTAAPETAAPVISLFE